MSESNSPADTRGLFCSTCRAYRSHYPRLSATRGPQGQRVRVLACAGCETERDFGDAARPGINCPNPNCRDTRFFVVYVRHRFAGTIRLKVCKSCGQRIQTCERITAKPTSFAN